MSDKKQFFIFCLGITILTLAVGLLTFLNSKPFKDNVTNFKITENGTLTKYIGSDSIVELPYIYTLDEKGNAKLGTSKLAISLSANAFKEDNNITRLAISIFIVNIEDGAFNNLTNLQTLVFRSKNPPMISASEFDALTNLKNIYVYKDYYDIYLDEPVFNNLQSIIKVI